MNKIIFLILACIFSLSISGQVFAYQNPVVNAGPDLYVASGGFNSNSSAILQGSAYDTNGASINFYWTCTNGSLSNSNIAQPLYTAPSGVWQSVIYTCTLNATNIYGLSSSDNALIYVNYNNNNNNNYFVNVQTNNATNNFNGQAVLNATISGNNNAGTVYGWFQWGLTSSYGYESTHRAVTYSGTFDQHVADLLPNTTYHFRAVAQGNNGIVYGQDMTFNSSGYSTTYVPQYYPQVLGASTISTGLTNDFLSDSFFLPLLIIVAGLWLYFSGEIYILADKLKAKIKK